MDILSSFLHNLPRSQLVQLAQTAIVTFLVGLISLGAFLLFLQWEDRKEAAADEKKDKDQTIIYGIKETAVTIQHQSLDQDDEEFLRHVRAFSRKNMEFHEFMETLENFTEFLHTHSHPNYEDMVTVRQILGWHDQADARSWLMVAQAFWILHPWEEMIPYIGYDVLPDSPVLGPVLERCSPKVAPAAETESHPTPTET